MADTGKHALTPLHATGEVVEGTQFKDLSTSMLRELVREGLEAERKKPQAAPSPSPDVTGGLWALIPKNQRPLVVIAMVVLGGGTGTWLANLSAIWGLPSEVHAIKQELATQREQLKEIKALLQGSTSKPR